MQPFYLMVFCIISLSMNPIEYYYSVGQCVSDPVRIARVKIKRSAFTCSLAYAGTMEEAKQFISKVVRENKTATHNCWAYIVGDTGETSHASDAGEPAGTAGKPMLNTLHSHGMTCVAAVVTRQFGGVKLGIRGLIEAYAQSVETAIDLTPLVRLVKTIGFQVQMPYGMNDTFLNQVKQFRAEIGNTEYGEQVVHDLVVEMTDGDLVGKFLSDHQARGRLKYKRETGN